MSEALLEIWKLVCFLLEVLRNDYLRIYGPGSLVRMGLSEQGSQGVRGTQGIQLERKGRGLKDMQGMVEGVAGVWSLHK